MSTNTDDQLIYEASPGGLERRTGGLQGPQFAGNPSKMNSWGDLIDHVLEEEITSQTLVDMVEQVEPGDSSPTSLQWYKNNFSDEMALVFTLCDTGISEGDLSRMYAQALQSPPTQ